MQGNLEEAGWRGRSPRAQDHGGPRAWGSGSVGSRADVTLGWETLAPGSR